MTKQQKKSVLKLPPKLKLERSTVLASRPGTKSSIILQLLNQDKGATVASLATTSGWQEHSIRGVMSGTLKKTLGLDVASQIIDGIRHNSVRSGRVKR